MTEFEKAKQRYEKKKAKVVPIKEEPKKAPDGITITIRDDGQEHEYHFDVGAIKNTRIPSQRNHDAYKDACGRFISEEFGRWRLTPTP